MDILIESIRSFEEDLRKLSEHDRTAVVEKINHCASFFPTQKADGYPELDPTPRLPDLRCYESSLYILRVSQKLSVILTVDEDPIFGQVIFTLFRVVKPDDLDRAYKGVAKSLYQELLHPDRETARIS